MILCENGAIGGVDVCGGSPGIRETDALNPLCNRKSEHVVFIAGGSAFGLDAGGGVMRFWGGAWDWQGCLRCPRAECFGRDSI